MSTVGDHYVELWGEPSREAEFEILGHAIEVYKWDADANPEDVAMYATIGASAAPTPGSPTHRNEFYVGLLPEHDAMAAPLAMLASYPLREGVRLDHGSTVLLPEPLWPDTEMTGFLILKSGTDLVPTLELPGGNHVVFLQATPVYEQEIEFKAARGPAGFNRLLDYWEENRVPHWDPWRDPAVPPDTSRPG